MQIQTYLNKNYDRYDFLGKVVKNYMAWKFLDFIDQGNIPVLQSAEYRVKSSQSIEVNLNANKYENFITPTDIEDLVGARIVCFYSSDAHTFCDLEKIKRLFGKNAHDTLKDYEKDGYRSFHFIMKVCRDSDFFNKALKENDKEKLEGLKIELQVRTILQHAFAESNHELNYKYELRVGRTLPAVITNQWLDAAENLTKIDKTIDKLRSDWETELLNIPTESYKKSYSKPEIADGCWNRQGVIYPYILLCDYLKKPKIKIVNELFSIDNKMMQFNAEKSYKNKMWKILEKSQAAELASITFDSMVTRVLDWDAKTKTMTVQPAFYSDQVVSNHKFALNKVVPGLSITIREIGHDSEGNLFDFKKSPLSNTLGTSVVVRTKDEKWVVSHRASSVAFDPYQMGTSASGAVEWNELGYWGEKNFENWFEYSMKREIGEELGDSSSQYQKNTDELVFLGFARELGRCGKPQLFFFYDSHEKDFIDLKELWRVYADSLSGNSNIKEFNDISELTMEEVEVLISDDEDAITRLLASHKLIVGVSQELRMNLALAISYLENHNQTAN